MRDYPSIPNVFRVSSVSSVNLLDDKLHTGCSSSDAVGLGLMGGITSPDSITNFPDNVQGFGGTVGAYRNNSGAYQEKGCSGATNNYSNSSVGNRVKGFQCNNGSVNNLNSFDAATSEKISTTNRQNLRTFERDDRGGYLLWIVTPVAASFSVAIVVAALAGPQWLFTEEKLPNVNYNGTANFNAKDDGAFITKYTKSSLWILCSTLQGVETYNCIKIDYFPKEEYRPDPHDSTLAVPYTITKSAPFFLISAIFLLISFTVFLVATCTHQNCLYYFASGILFIVSGLLMLIGLIVYISIFKAEIGSKLRPKSTLQPPLYMFSYGQSFFLYVFGFVSTEFVGVLNIFLYISLQQVGHHKTIPCLPFIGGHEKIVDIETSSRQSLRPYDERSGAGGGFTCKKHAVQSTNILSYSDAEQRYYFEKAQKCGIHSKNLAKSLNELYTEPAPTFSPFDLPQEFPLTRSVSTTTDIFSNNNHTTNNGSALHNYQTSTLEKRNKKNQTNDESSKDSLNDICGFSRSILSKGRKSKDELFNEFCRKAGMRPKPKDIYYIEDNPTDHEEESIFIVDNYATLAKNRRSSFMEPHKRNSNSSLRPLDKVYPKSLFDLDRCESDQWNNYPDHYLTNKSNSRDMNIYHSRTLPRCFMKRNFEPDNRMLPREHRHSLGFEGPKNFYSSENMLHKSFDEVNSINYEPRKPCNNLQVQWPTAIPTSPSSFSTKSTIRYSGDQTGYYSRQNFFRPQSQQYEEPKRQQGAYGTFDLDKIERERRKSHASLFEVGMGYDVFNGTAV